VLTIPNNRYDASGKKSLKVRIANLIIKGTLRLGIFVVLGNPQDKGCLEVPGFELCDPPIPSLMVWPQGHNNPVFHDSFTIQYKRERQGLSKVQFMSKIKQTALLTYLLLQAHSS